MIGAIAVGATAGVFAMQISARTKFWPLWVLLACPFASTLSLAVVYMLGAPYQQPSSAPTPVMVALILGMVVGCAVGRNIKKART